MSISDYIIDILLIALVLRQIRPRALTPRSVVLPAVLLALAGSEYLKGFPTAGNDLVLILILIAIGAAFGVVTGLTTRVWKTSTGMAMAQASVVAAVFWVLGTGGRMAFDIWAHTSSGESSLISFSLRHSITNADAYSTAFVLMAFAQVIIRIAILQFRRIRLTSSTIAAAN